MEEQVLSKFSRLSKRERVLTGLSALCWAGVSNGNDLDPCLLIDLPALDGVQYFNGVSYFYTDQPDTTYECTPMKAFPHIKIPSKERAFVELVKYDLKAIDEGMFCDALYDYINSPSYDEDRLKRTAAHFNVPWEKVQYWLGEAREYTDC